MKAVLSIVLAVAFSTMSVLACGSETPTGNGTPTVASVVVTPANAPLVSLEETVQLTGTAQDASGNTISGKTFSWSSADQSVATVNSSGLVTAVANGSATVTATTDGVNGTATVVVDQVSTQLTFTAQPTKNPPGTSITPEVEVEVRDALGNSVTDGADAVTLAVGNNPSGGSLSGTLTRSAVNGVATFDDLSIAYGEDGDTSLFRPRCTLSVRPCKDESLGPSKPRNPPPLPRYTE